MSQTNRRVETETADRLQRHLGGERGRVAQLEKPTDAATYGAILRQVSPGLSHQPDWRRRQRLACEHRSIADPELFPTKAVCSFQF